MLRLFQAFALSAIGFAAAADAVPGTKSGYVEVDDGTRLYYDERGTGSPVLIVPVAVYLAPQLLEPLSTNRRVIFYDPRNRGRSDAAPLETVSLERQLADLEALRTALGIEQFALLGWSGLGMEMAVYAIRHPQRVSHLVQMAAVPPAAEIMRAAGDGRDERTDADAVAALDARAAAGEFDAAPGVYCRERNRLTDPASFADPSLAVLVPDVCAHENEWPASLWPYFGALLPSFGDYDWRPLLADLDVPRLVIHGREDGIPLAGARAWAAGYLNARLLVLSPAGHFPHIEQHAAVVEAIDEFLAGCWPQGAEAVPPP